MAETDDKDWSEDWMSDEQARQVLQSLRPDSWPEAPATSGMVQAAIDAACRRLFLHQHEPTNVEAFVQRIAELEAEIERRNKRIDDGTLCIHPGYQFGRVCCGSSRVPASAVAECVSAGDNVDHVAVGYDLSRLQILTACWWYVDRLTDIPASRQTKAQKRVMAGWGGWHQEAALILGGWHRDKGIQPHDCPDPPEIIDG